MKRLAILCLMACMGVAVLQAQITLPTKKTKGTTATVKVETPQKSQSSQKSQSPQSSQQSQKTKPGAITLPTVKKTASDSTATPGTPILAGGELKPLPVVVRKTAPRAKPIVKKPKPEDNEIYESAEHMPTYPGGANELMKFISDNLQYPAEALANDSIDETTIIQVSFIVEKDGSPKDFQVIDEHNPLLEAEAVRVLMGMPKWKPATQSGVKVRVEYVVPVKFKKPKQ